MDSCPVLPSQGIEYATEEDELLDKLDGMDIEAASNAMRLHACS